MRRNRVRKNTAIKCKSAVSTGANGSSPPSATDGICPEIIEFNLERNNDSVGAGMTDESSGSTLLVSSQVSANDDMLVATDPRDEPSTFSIYRRNIVYRIPDHYMFTDAQHSDCSCFYCSLVYPEDGLSILFHTSQPKPEVLNVELESS